LARSEADRARPADLAGHASTFWEGFGNRLSSPVVDPESGIQNRKGAKDPKENKTLQCERRSPQGECRHWSKALSALPLFVFFAVHLLFLG
jgi:hypothetical protein